MSNNSNTKKLRFMPDKLRTEIAYSRHTIIDNTLLVPKRYQGDAFMKDYETKALNARFSNKKAMKTAMKDICYHTPLNNVKWT